VNEEAMARAGLQSQREKNCFSNRKKLNEIEAVFMDRMSNQRNTRAIQISLAEKGILYTYNHHVPSTFLLCVIYKA
jgi:hypothetical protein